METVRSLSGLAHRTRQGRTLATIPKSTSTMSPFSGKFVIQDFRGRAEVVPDLLQGLVGFRERRKRRQTVGDQVTKQVGQGFSAAICFCQEHLVILLPNPDRIGDGLHVYILTTRARSGKPFLTGTDWKGAPARCLRFSASPGAKERDRAGVMALSDRISRNAPPLPCPLLHFMVEREFRRGYFGAASSCAPPETGLRFGLAVKPVRSMPSLSLTHFGMLTLPRGVCVFGGARTFLSAALPEHEEGPVFLSGWAKQVAADKNVRAPRQRHLLCVLN
jgi:hypothetical protein